MRSTDVLLASGATPAIAATVMWLLGRKQMKGREDVQEKSAQLRLNVRFRSLGVRAISERTEQDNA